VRCERARHSDEWEDEIEWKHYGHRQQASDGEAAEVARSCRGEGDERSQQITACVGRLCPFPNGKAMFEGKVGRDRVVWQAGGYDCFVQKKPGDQDGEITIDSLHGGRRPALVGRQKGARIHKVIAEAIAQIVSLIPKHERSAARRDQGRDQPQSAGGACGDGYTSAEQAETGVNRMGQEPEDALRNVSGGGARFIGNPRP